MGSRDESRNDRVRNRGQRCGDVGTAGGRHGRGDASDLSPSSTTWCSPLRCRRWLRSGARFPSSATQSNPSTSAPNTTAWSSDRSRARADCGPPTVCRGTSRANYWPLTTSESSRRSCGRRTGSRPSPTPACGGSSTDPMATPLMVVASWGGPAESRTSFSCAVSASSASCLVVAPASTQPNGSWTDSPATTCGSWMRVASDPGRRHPATATRVLSTSTAMSTQSATPIRSDRRGGPSAPIRCTRRCSNEARSWGCARGGNGHCGSPREV